MPVLEIEGVGEEADGAEADVAASSSWPSDKNGVSSCSVDSAQRYMWWYLLHNVLF